MAQFPVTRERDGHECLVITTILIGQRLGSSHPDQKQESTGYLLKDGDTAFKVFKVGEAFEGRGERFLRK